MNKKWMAALELLAAICFAVSFIFRPDTGKLILTCIWLLAFAACCFRLSKSEKS